MVKCAKCAQPVPADAVYCPHCAGDGKTSEREVIRGGVIGGVKGLLIGLLPAIWLLMQYGPERGIKAIALTLPIATFTTGLIIGLVRAKREWR